jgi:hypothetical protein
MRTGCYALAMRRLQFRARACELVSCTPALAWVWVDRLPQALTEFPFISDVRPAQSTGAYRLTLGPVGYGKVSMSLAMDMFVIKESGRHLSLRSLPDTGNADAIVDVEVIANGRTDACTLTITLDVSPHKPASSLWPRELIEKASSASLQVAARKMLKDMKAAIEGGAAAQLTNAATATDMRAAAARSAAQSDLPR